eukprot:SAG11_NODE_1066_length_5987_cov_3.977412_2_plen_55_part_00
MQWAVHNADRAVGVQADVSGAAVIDAIVEYNRVPRRCCQRNMRRRTAHAATGAA